MSDEHRIARVCARAFVTVYGVWWIGRGAVVLFLLFASAVFEPGSLQSAYWLLAQTHVSVAIGFFLLAFGHARVRRAVDRVADPDTGSSAGCAWLAAGLAVTGVIWVAGSTQWLLFRVASSLESTFASGPFSTARDVWSLDVDDWLTVADGVLGVALLTSTPRIADAWNRWQGRPKHGDPV